MRSARLSPLRNARIHRTHDPWEIVEVMKLNRIAEIFARFFSVDDIPTGHPRINACAFFGNPECRIIQSCLQAPRFVRICPEADEGRRL